MGWKLDCYHSDWVHRYRAVEWSGDTIVKTISLNALPSLSVSLSCFSAFISTIVSPLDVFKAPKHDSESDRDGRACKESEM